MEERNEIYGVESGVVEKLLVGSMTANFFTPKNYKNYRVFNHCQDQSPRLM